ncbi:MAG: hypothetical protein V7735_14785 [Photobacterium frigidiphilum]|uniref:hypothetical protein n=1 Tax=Photobacterium frigidiphilum TaxID=264736 RepID=UPI003002C510
MDTIEKYNRKQIEKFRDEVKQKIDVINASEVQNEFARAISDLSLLQIESTNEAERNSRLLIDSESFLIWPEKERLTLKHCRPEQIPTELAALKIGCLQGWILPTKEELERFLFRYQKAHENHQFGFSASSYDDYQHYLCDEGILIQGRIISFDDVDPQDDVFIIPKHRVLLNCAQLQHCLRTIERNNISSGVVRDERWSSEVVNSFSNFQYELGDLGYQITFEWLCDYGDHVKTSTVEKIGQELDILILSISANIEHARRILIDRLPAYQATYDELTKHLESSYHFFSDDECEKYHLITPCYLQKALEKQELRFKQMVSKNSIVDLEQLRDLHASLEQELNRCAPILALVEPREGALELKNNVTELPWHLLIEQQEHLLKQYLDTDIEPIKHNFKNLYSEIEQNQSELNGLVLEQGSLAPLTQWEAKPRPSVALVSYVYFKALKTKLGAAELVLENREQISDLFDQLALLNQRISNTFHQSWPHFEQLCVEEKISVKHHQQWISHWQFRYEEVLIRVNELLSLTLPFAYGLRNLSQLLGLITHYVIQLDDYFLDKAIYIHQKHHDKNSYILFEQLEMEKYLFQINSELVKNALTFRNGLPKDDFLRWLEAWSVQNLASFVELFNQQYDEKLSCTLLSEIHAMKLESLDMFIADAEQYDKFLEQRDKAFTSLMYKMTKELK